MLVGEVPGDQEDRLGHPFVGPAGQILQHCLAEAGLERENVYITNVVKHFKFERRGKVRLHKKPNSAEVHACQPWLDQEIALVKPKILVCLGSTAAQALLGADFRVTRMRGKWIDSRLAPRVLATVHPSSILRGPHEERDRETRNRLPSHWGNRLSSTPRPSSSRGSAAPSSFACLWIPRARLCPSRLRSSNPAGIRPSIPRPSLPRLGYGMRRGAGREGPRR